MAVIAQEINDRYAAYNGDCCEVLPDIPKESVGLSIYSPPFAELYNYSSSPRDLSNCKDYDEFMEHYEFVVSQIARVTKPGRESCVHCMDIRKGSMLRDFPGDIVRLHEKYGFGFHCRFTIWKEPLRVAIRTRSLHLTHRQLVKDSTLVGSAGADYLLVFRKDGDNPEPVEHPTGMTEYAGQNVPPQEGQAWGFCRWLWQEYARLKQEYADHKDAKTNKLSHWIFQQYASSVWMDVKNGNVLPYRHCKETEDEKHVCPLQLDVIERCLALFSNPKDIVLTPFMGVGSEVYCAVRNGRRAIGIELKPSYYRQALENIKLALVNDKDAQLALNLASDAEEVEIEKDME